jgi:predicted transcriptional regulator of viral defense system
MASLAERGWLSRIRRNCYTTVPLGATAPREWREAPWLVAARTFAPCYIGGWNACEHWGLTEQIFRELIVLTTRRVRHRREVIQDTTFRLRVAKPARMFGLVEIWRGQNRVPVSDPAHTVVDLLNDPSIGGGMRNVAEVLQNYFGGYTRNDAQLIDHALRLGNRTISERLGYRLKALMIDAPTLGEACQSRISSGVSCLIRRPGPSGGSSNAGGCGSMGSPTRVRYDSPTEGLNHTPEHGRGSVGRQLQGEEVRDPTGKGLGFCSGLLTGPLLETHERQIQN